MKKVAIFVFKDNPLCFIHVLLNVLHMKDEGYDALIVLEGEATRLLLELEKAGNPLEALWSKALQYRLIDGVCKACATKTGAVKAAESQGLNLINELSGHPSMARYIDAGYELLIF